MWNEMCEIVEEEKVGFFEVLSVLIFFLFE